MRAPSLMDRLTRRRIMVSSALVDRGVHRIGGLTRPPRSWWLAAWMLTTASIALAQSSADPGPVLATVNGTPIRTADLELLALTRRLSPEQRQAARDSLLEELIDQRLMSAYLESRKTAAAPEEVESRLAGVRSMIERSGRDPQEVLQKLAITDDMLRRSLALPLAWNRHVRRVVTAEQLQQQFTAHRARYDGSRRRISQIVRPIPRSADDAAARAQAAQELLQRVRSEIVGGQLTFAEAARRYSESPSAAGGGDLGWATFGTRLPKELAVAAFDLPVGEVSQPVRTSFGVHLLLVTEAEPGDLSLEDVRDEVLADLGAQLWREQLEQLRSTASIQRQR